jgi:hypothetical protein
VRLLVGRVEAEYPDMQIRRISRYAAQPVVRTEIVLAADLRRDERIVAQAAEGRKTASRKSPPGLRWTRSRVQRTDENVHPSPGDYLPFTQTATWWTKP